MEEEKDREVLTPMENSSFENLHSKITENMARTSLPPANLNITFLDLPNCFINIILLRRNSRRNMCLCILSIHIKVIGKPRIIFQNTVTFMMHYLRRLILGISYHKVIQTC